MLPLNDRRTIESIDRLYDWWVAIPRNFFRNEAILRLYKEIQRRLFYLAECWAAIIDRLAELAAAQRAGTLLALQRFSARLSRWVGSPQAVTDAMAFDGCLAAKAECFCSVTPMHFSELVPVLLNPTALVRVGSVPIELIHHHQGTLSHVGNAEPDHSHGA